MKVDFLTRQIALAIRVALDSQDECVEVGAHGAEIHSQSWFSQVNHLMGICYVFHHARNRNQAR
jgi:hypothetical protein